MIDLIAGYFIKEPININDKRVRQIYGKISCIVGIALNILLFAGKYLAGVISHSVAIIADSFNNLSDAGSSVITLVGFQMAGKKADLEHPFGHGRVEYLSGLAVSVIIIIMGVELLQNSVVKIIHPTEVDTSILSFAILIVSIAVKIYMAYYNKKIGARIRSTAMEATAADSISDAVATTVVLISMLLTRFFGLKIDGICGLLVAVFILRAGYCAVKDTLSPLLGQAPEPEFVDEIKEIVMANTMVQGMHDLVVHDYGPGRCMISLHVEIPGDQNIFEIHDLIDQIEEELKNKLDCEAVIHMDPIEVDNKEINYMKSLISENIKNLDDRLTIHDFRMVKGPTHTNVIFDVVLPQTFPMGEEEVRFWVCDNVKKNFDNVYAVVKVEKSYI